MVWGVLPPLSPSGIWLIGFVLTVEVLIINTILLRAIFDYLL